MEGSRNVRNDALPALPDARMSHPHVPIPLLRGNSNDNSEQVRQVNKIAAWQFKEQKDTNLMEKQS